MNVNQPKQLKLDNQWVNKHLAANSLGISTHTLKLYRKKYWIEGIHYQHLNSRTIRYHQELLIDWMANQSCPKVHQNAIEVYLASLSSNQQKKRVRSSK